MDDYNVCNRFAGGNTCSWCVDSCLPKGDCAKQTRQQNQDKLSHHNQNWIGVVVTSQQAKPGEFVYKYRNDVPYVGLYHVLENATIVAGPGIMGSRSDVNSSDILLSRKPLSTYGWFPREEFFLLQ